jgi:GNAT superfamily N-acetyltransferase
MTIEVNALPNFVDPSSRELQALFEEMYAHFEQIAGRNLLRPEGFVKWAGQYDSARDRGRIICAARDNEKIIGFAEGILRTAPGYYAPEIIGFVSHLYVRPAARGRGVAKDMYGWLKGWFLHRKVSSIELQIVAGNESANRFWESRGFRPDLVQMRAKIG